MLTGRWLLFFGFIWVLTNVLVSGLSSAVGAQASEALGYSVSSKDLGTIAIVGDPDDFLKLNVPIDSATSVELSGNFFKQAYRVAQNVYSWGSLDYPDVLEGPVWGIVRQVWSVFGMLLLILSLWTVKSFLRVL